MMCEIKSRGKRLDNGEWARGFYIKYGYTGREKSYIVPEYASALYAFEVDPATVGRCTELTDKKFEDIYEGDIVACLHKKFKEKTPRNCYEFVDEGDPIFPLTVSSYKRNYAVEWWRPQTHYRVINGGIHFHIKQSTINGLDAEVIGNIHDNPELLEATHG